ncbi:hypothetical protein B0H12DRAFT_1246922 [Mycena haematopus]|nr:hypothetical protein B0H12DRAFT_1246922 [Mycena haematopus]
MPVSAKDENEDFSDMPHLEDDDPNPTVLGKRKTYQSSTDPMGLWRPCATSFLDEIVRHDALGDNDAPELTCALCTCKDIGVHLFKCGECGEFLQCQRCCVTGHARTPLHIIEEWNGQFWVDVTLQELGLVYQLGHGGLQCPYPDPRLLTMSIIHLPVIHRVKFRYCKCQRADDTSNVQQCLRNKWFPATITDPATCATFSTLETFRLHNVTKATVSTGMDWVPHRYKEFMRMSRQWAFLKRAKRAGLAHNPAGLESTGLREAAVRCWACPHDGRNLPADWRDVDPQFRFLYMLLVAVDANFKLKNRMRGNEHPDPSLGPGWGYFVEPKKYRKHIKNYVPEKDVSIVGLSRC